MKYIYSLLWKSDGSEGIAWHIRGIKPDGSFYGEIRFDSLISEKRKMGSAIGVIPNEDWGRCCEILEEFSALPIDESSIKPTSTPIPCYASLWRRDKSCQLLDVPFSYNLGDEKNSRKARLFLELKEILEKEISKSYAAIENLVPKLTPTKEEQFVALLKGEGFDLVKKYSNGDPVRDRAHRDFFDITKSEFTKWLRGNYKLKTLPFVYLKPSNEDGYYIIKEGGLFWSYRTYYQEKLVHMDECCVGSLKKVYDKYVDHLWKGWDL